MNTSNTQSDTKTLRDKLQQKINSKTKPIGSLGQLEEIALKVGLIQKTESPKLTKPTIVVFAGDHGIANEGVSPYPQSVTHQMVLNFLNGGAAINVFCRQNGIDLKIVDAGVNFDFKNTAGLINAKIGYGTKNYLTQKAMSDDECDLALKKGAEIVAGLHKQGTNIIGFGEMGIGNTSSASLLMSVLNRTSIENCVGRGAGLNDVQLKKKAQLLKRVLQTHSVNQNDPLEILATFGGFEIAMISGGILEAAKRKMIILVDGFIVSSSFLAAYRINPKTVENAFFCHQSDEHGHQELLKSIEAKPILNLNLRLGEGSGAAVAYPIIEAAVNFLNEMASFESAGVSKKNA